MSGSSKPEVVWFKNKATGRIEGVNKGTPEHKRMLTELTGGDEPELVWSKTSAPASRKPVKFVSGAGPTFVAARGRVEAADDDEGQGDQ